MEVKRAYTWQEGWVDLTCEWCNASYSCHVKEMGSADTGWLGLLGIVPSDETMKAAAEYDLKKAMERAAHLVPCPKCGKYCNQRVVAMQERAFKIGKWLSFIGLTVVLLAPLVVLNAPAWTLLIALPVAWIAGTVIGRIFAAKVDPNQNTGANRAFAQRAIARGVVRVQ